VPGAPLLFALFAAVLIGVAVWHERALAVAAAGLAVILAARLAFTPFDLAAHLAREWVKLVDLFGLLVGFALVADHFERSHITDLLARRLPAGARGCFALLALTWLVSGVLDNIAAALVGATIAADLYDRRVHVGYLSAIVAAANAGGAGSVIGDTTTTMMWLDGVRPQDLLPGYIGSAAALMTFGIFASFQQAKYGPLAPRPEERRPVDGWRLGIVLVTLAFVVGTNVAVNVLAPAWAEKVPWVAIALWVALLGGGLVRAPGWRLAWPAARGSLFLMCLVLAASLMPAQSLPRPSWVTTLGLGLLSSVFDNIPLTKMALDQGGYDVALLAYAVGVGGSMVWFGSSAGVAVSASFPEARSVARWLRGGWYVPLAFLVGFFTLLAVGGWHP
jgi:hypothetical protein